MIYDVNSYAIDAGERFIYGNDAKKKTLFKAAKPNGANGGEGFSQPECQILHLKDTRQMP